MLTIRSWVVPLLWLTVSGGAACRSADADPRGSPADKSPATGKPLATAAPVLSRGKRVAAWSPLLRSSPEHVNDGDPTTSWGAGKPQPGKPAWVAIDVGQGPPRVLLTWSAAGSYNYEETDYGSPGAYRIETSADSTDGANGAWHVVAQVPSVVTHGQEHSFDFTGQRWVKFVVTSAPENSPNGVQIDEIELHDATTTPSEGWFFMGDSITAFAFGRPPAHEPGFASRVHADCPGFFPAVINGGIGGEKSEDGARHIDEWLARSPDAYFWAVSYGTNDSAGDSTDTAPFKRNLEVIVDRARAAHRVPILATIPYASDGQHSNIPKFNDVIKEIGRARGLPTGPDLYAWFLAHPDELRDGIHPNETGISSINRLWAAAAAPLYKP